MHLPLASIPLLATLVSAGRDTGRPGHGLIGYGIEMYIPVCAYACQNSFSSNPLVCADDASAMPSSTCRAESEPFLTSVAWCIHLKCSDTLVWKIEKWWQSYVVGNQPTDPPPGLSYGTALGLVTSPPNAICMSGQVLNETSLADEMLYTALYISTDVNQDVEIQHERFGLVVLLSGVVIPVGFSLLRFLPFPRRWSSALNGRLIYPSLLRPWRDSPVAAIVSDPPTRGQALFIALASIEIMGDLANRFGVLSFANFVLLVLYSSRNNVLPRLTNWQHSTFVLLHRWVARIAVLQAILHSVVFLRDWIREDRLADDQVLPYWWWGCIATIAASLILPLSIPILRQRIYELFLETHVALSVLVFLGSWYHIIFRYEHQWGYETWLYAVFAVSGYDRLLQFLRTLRNGVRTARLTAIDDDYIRINVKGIVGSGHVYLYFLYWRFWENHPFSITSSIIQQSGSFSSTETIDSVAGGVDIDPEKWSRMAADSFDQTLETGMVFYLRLLEGGTKALRNKTQLPVLIEGPYGNHEDLSEYPTLLCIAGGVGVTAVYWGSRTQALVDSMKPLTHSFHLEVAVGQRLDLRTILEGQLDNFAVVVSGPPGMMDEACEIVARVARKKRVKFIAESFTY
ncbi:ferric reductase like transmembrane component-domain-containing protein [Hypoxylon sp. NC0597]|nr:ferric reductase like transmembrane component-domain-containing protein [Hypoxylon sp. NC0597]